MLLRNTYELHDTTTSNLYKVGDVFKVTGTTASSFLNGLTCTLLLDDNSSMPHFEFLEIEGGDKTSYYVGWADLSRVPVKKPKKHKNSKAIRSLELAMTCIQVEIERLKAE